MPSQFAACRSYKALNVCYGALTTARQKRRKEAIASVARKKAAENCAVPAWASAKLDCKEKRFTLIGNSLFFNEQFQALSAGAKHVYIAMTLECGGRRGFQFPHAAAKKYGIAPRSFDRYFDELTTSGFISKSSGQNTRTPNEYCFEFGWKPRAIKPP